MRGTMKSDEPTRWEDGNKKLVAAFCHLLRRGILARRNFLCCSGCATYSLGIELEKSDQAWLGVAYTHGQSEDDWENQGGQYVGFGCREFSGEEGGDPDAYDEETERAAELVGMIVAASFLEAGLAVEWNGDSATKIWVEIPKKKVT